jgi:hypothetical protein
MVALRHGFVVRHARFLRSLAVILGLAFVTVGAHDLKRPMPTERASCEEITVARQLEWHRQQTEAVELHSLTGLLRLFTTVADELAAESTDYYDIDSGRSVIACGAPATNNPM